VTSSGAEAWLDRLLAGRLPDVGRIRLSPMLNEAGRLMGDLSVTRLGPDRFWLTGSYYLQAWHMRWFDQHRPEGDVSIENITPTRMGFSISGPASRAILAELTDEDVSDEAFPFMAVREIKVGSVPAVVGRISLTGERGYEIVVATPDELVLWQELAEAGGPHGLRPVGDDAVDSLRLEKGYGIWNAEYTQRYTPGESGLDRFVAWDKGPFVGREAALREREEGPSRRLVSLEVDAADAEASADDGIWLGERLVGSVTSGAYGHHVGDSLALAYVDGDVIASNPELEVAVIGESRPCRILPEPPYDPEGRRLREGADDGTVDPM
jgi:dimethylglycine dehydrogenase